MKSLFKHLGEL